ncbi:histidinol-phosphate transaminase [Streptomyces sodiiphilus]|uniref:Aromatic amino acid aminotransferase n=1 Tax=Streptomyces sodiiphilus TaxID=226217 RepID=A0ABN2NUI8_9ACTN
MTDSGYSGGPFLRPAVARVPHHAPGGTSSALRRLAANETPWPPPPSVAEALREAALWSHRYPDRGSRELTEALAERLRVPMEHLATGTGSVGLLKQLLQSTVQHEGDEVAYAWLSFEAYPHLSAVAGARVRQIPLRDERHDLEALADAVGERTRLVIVCNPNNPTGTTVRRAELERFLDRVPERTLVVLDEAYREFVRDPDVPDGLEHYRDRPNVAVLRTFSKAYGLAGLRVGYAVAAAPVAAALRACAVPFGVSGPAQYAALAALRTEDELMERVNLLVSERKRVTDGLRALGYSVPGSEANFLWLRLGERSVCFAAACAEAGVLVRAFPGEGVRVTLGLPEENDLVLRAAAGADAAAPG